MFNFLVGVVFGIIVSTIGLSGVANLVDRGVQSTKAVIQEQAKQSKELKVVDFLIEFSYNSSVVSSKQYQST